MKVLKPLADPAFIVPTVIVAAVVAIAAVYVWNTHAVPKIAEKTGKDLTA